MARLYEGFGLRKAWAEREKLKERLRVEKDDDIIAELTGQLRQIENRIEYLEDMSQ